MPRVAGAILRVASAAAICAAFLAGPVRADLPATAPHDMYSGRQINRDAEPADNSSQSTVPARPSGDFDIAHVTLALGSVLALILVLRWSARRLFAGPAARGSTRSIRVLSRCVIAPKQQILLLQIGQRLVVVGDTGAQLNPLCQITDTDEVAALLGEIRKEQAPSVKSPFAAIFGLAGKRFDADLSNAAGQMKDAGELHAGATADTDGSAALASTRQELDGLSDKIRGLAKQLGQG